jgi:hypothetical protein
MVETIIIAVLFLAAVGYLLNVVRKSFSTKSNGCAKGCGGACGSIDFKKIEAEINRKKAVAQ